MENFINYGELRMIIIICSLFFFFFGTIIGSFLGVLSSRLPQGENVIKGRSYCNSCRKTLKPLDLVPVFSWIFLRGKCRYCNEKISSRHILTELITGISFTSAFLALGYTGELVIVLILFSVLITLSIIDYETSEIPYWSSAVIAVLGLAAFIFSIFYPGFSGVFWYEHLIGLFIVSVPFAIFAYLGAMGGGDVQLVAAAGFLLGWAIVPATLIAFITGAVFGIYIKATRKSARISFGPFLSLGIAVCALWGNDILLWYINFLK